MTMTMPELLQLLQFPEEIIHVLNDYAGTRTVPLPEETKHNLLTRKHWKEGLEQLRAFVGEDPNGFKRLWEMLNLACGTWEKYEAYGISREIYAETMKMCVRSMKDYYKSHHCWQFIWDWWYTREISFLEFRVGCLEYELYEEDERFVSIHIPSDADMSPASIDASFREFAAFLKKHFPEWTDARWGCDSWMLSPALKELLPEDSKILAFQNRFQVETVDEESLGVLEWVFPPHEKVSEDLPENTSLQKKMKAYLLAGKKVGWTKGFLRPEAYPER